MTRFANSRRFWPFVALLCLVAAGAVACLTAGAHRPETSDVYRRYANLPGVDATFVKAYPVNDTLSVDVTLLQATDTAAWHQLSDDFRFNNDTKATMAKLTDSDLECLAVITSQRYYADSTANKKFIGVVSPIKKYICIFHCTDTQTWNRLFNAVYDKVYFSLKSKEDIVNKTVINNFPNTKNL